VAAPVLTALVAAASLHWGTVPVSKVVLEAPGYPAPHRLRHVFGVPEGSMLSRSEIRSGVQALVATGVIEDVVVNVEEDDDGAVIRVQVQPASRVQSVNIVGLPSSEKKQVRATLGLVMGAPFWVPVFEAALERARQGMVESGFPDARLSPDLVFSGQTSGVAVTVRGELGKPVTVRRLEAPGLPPKSGELWAICRLKTGQRLTTANLESARRRLAAHLRREGFWEAEVASPVVSEGAEGASVKLEVHGGPHYELDLEGLKRTKSLELQALSFVRGEETFSEAAVDVVVERVRMFLQQDGRLLAKVQGEVIEKGSERVLQLKVDPGPRTPVLAVRFPGLHSLPEKEMRQGVGAHPGRFWRWGREPVNNETLDADASSVLAMLRAAGFADAKVEAPRIVPSGDEVVIEFPVEEGARSLVRSVAIEGVPADVSTPELPVVQGGPWSQSAEEQAGAALEATLMNGGYPDARVNNSHACGENSCSVTFRAEPGERAVVGRIVVAGLVRTSPRVVEKVAGIKAGEVAGPEARLAAQRRLLALGIFQNVSIEPIPDQESGSRRGMVIDVAEGPTGAYAFGLGYDTERKAQVALSWSELNLFGTGRSLTFDSRLSRLESRFQLTYREPQRLGLLGFPTSVSIYQTQQTFTSYEVFQRGTLVEFGDRRKRPWRWLLRFDYQMVDNTAPSGILSDLERSQQSLHIASLTPSLTWDTRNDILVATSGSYASVEWQRAFKLFQADAEFDLLNLSFSTYQPAAGGVLAFSLRGGAIEPRHPQPDRPDNLQVPVNVRFFAGGRATHRAFPIDLLGIQGETFDCQKLTLPDGTPSDKCNVPVKLVATGGAGLLVTSLEWRFPIFSVLGGTLFVDGGNVWSAWRAIRVGQMRWGGGIGLRVETPVGPVRLEYGWKFKQLTYVFDKTADGIPHTLRESPGELFFSFGNAF
jgi:outer membrane protein insertion porin family